jgi:hypothetical protein
MAFYILLTFANEVEAHVVAQRIREQIRREPRVMTLDQLTATIQRVHPQFAPTATDTKAIPEGAGHASWPRDETTPIERPPKRRI